jgi:hypothetical protein
MYRPWWRLVAFQTLPTLWPMTWLDSTAGLTATRITASSIAVGTKVAAWGIRAPGEQSGVYTIFNVSIVGGEICRL